MAAGSLLVPALGFRDAILATIIGSVIGSALLAVVGRIGSDTGVPTMVALRPALGMRAIRPSRTTAEVTAVMRASAGPHSPLWPPARSRSPRSPRR